MFLTREILDLMKKTNALHPVQVSFSLLVYLLRKVKKKMMTHVMNCRPRFIIYIYSSSY